MIGLTTGRETNPRLNSLVKDLAHAIPDAIIVRRGKSNLQSLRERFLEHGLKHGMAVYKSHGGPGRIELLDFTQTKLSKTPPTIILKEVRLCREFGEIRGPKVEALSLDDNATAETIRLAQSLQVTTELLKISANASKWTRATLHVSRDPNRELTITVVSSHGGREVGPRLTVAKLVWDADE